MEIEDITKYLPKKWKELSRETEALTRSRQIKTPEELLELNLLYLTMGGSYAKTAALLNMTTEMKLSKQAVYLRIKQSWKWLQKITEEMCASNGIKSKKPEWLDRNVIAIDGSELCNKGSKTGNWRLHLAFDIFGFSYRTIEITDIKQGETLSRHMVNAGDIILADRLYGTIKGMEHIKDKNGDFILRYRTKAFNLYDESRNRLNLLSILSPLTEGESTSVECFYYHEGSPKPVRIVAMRKSKEAIIKAQRQMKKKLNKQRGREPSDEALKLNEYVILATSLDYSNERILELYRARWQIEEVFLRLKELYSFGEVPSKRDDSVKEWFYGKLFLAVLAETIMKTESFSPGGDKRSDSFAYGQCLEDVGDY